MAERIRYQLVGPFTVLITGAATAGAPRGVWTSALRGMGSLLQGKIADSFASERVAGSSQLGRNTPEYNAYKARAGFDTRRGHKTNFLQSMLRPGASELFTVSGPTKDGRATIKFHERRLHSIVPYAQYYEIAKVRRAGILELANVWLKQTRTPVDNVQMTAVATVAEKAVKARAAAPRVLARIRPALGLTHKVGMRISTGAGTAAQRAAERFLRSRR